MDNNPKKTLTLTEHLGELRRCFLITFIALIITSGVGLFFSHEIFNILQSPFENLLVPGQSFITLTPTEAWLVYLKVGIAFGFIASSPIWLYQLWKFIAPALAKGHKKTLMLSAVLSSLFFVGGVAVGYFFILPFGLQYFISLLSGTDILLMPRMSLYLGFALKLLFAFGLLGLIPVFLFLLLHFKIVSRKALAKKRPYIIVGAFLLAAVITPPDIITQIAIALPIIILFELTLITAKIFR